MTDILDSTGARVLTAASAAEALAVLDRTVPDVLLADLAMPHVDGLDLISQIRHHRRKEVREIPAAALTAYARPEDRVKALRAGFQVHLAKPVDPAELMTTMAALARRLPI